MRIGKRLKDFEAIDNNLAEIRSLLDGLHAMQEATTEHNAESLAEVSRLTVDILNTVTEIRACNH